MIKKKILIFGCGSVGAHHANAAIRNKYKVFITDVNKGQFLILKNKLYPSRYGKWDRSICFINYKKILSLKNYFDLIVIGSSPKSHIEIFKKIYKKLKYKKILIEKPLCVYNQSKEFSKYKLNNVFCGFNHSISPSIRKVFKIVNKKDMKPIEIY